MTDKTPDRVLATTGLYPRFVGDWSEGEWLPVHPEEQVACYRVEYVRADLHAAVVAERDQLKAALKEIMCDSLDVSTRILAAQALENCQCLIMEYYNDPELAKFAFS